MGSCISLHLIPLPQNPLAQPRPPLGTSQVGAGDKGHQECGTAPYLGASWGGQRWVWGTMVRGCATLNLPASKPAPPEDAGEVPTTPAPQPQLHPIFPTLLPRGCSISGCGQVEHVSMDGGAAARSPPSPQGDTRHPFPCLAKPGETHPWVGRTLPRVLVAMSATFWKASRKATAASTVVLGRRERGGSFSGCWAPRDLPVVGEGVSPVSLPRPLT